MGVLNQISLEQDSFTELIDWKSVPVARSVYADIKPEQAEFVTPNDLPQQVGLLVYPADSSIPRNLYKPTERTTCGTPGVLISGRYGFPRLKDTIFREVKQGPYVGPQEKERF